MSEPLQMAPFNTKEQRFYSESLTDDQTSHLVSEGDGSQPPEGTFSMACIHDLILSIIHDHR